MKERGEEGMHTVEGGSVGQFIGSDPSQSSPPFIVISSSFKYNSVNQNQINRLLSSSPPLLLSSSPPLLLSSSPPLLLSSSPPLLLSSSPPLLLSSFLSTYFIIRIPFIYEVAIQGNAVEKVPFYREKKEKKEKEKEKEKKEKKEKEKKKKEGEEKEKIREGKERESISL